MAVVAKKGLSRFVIIDGNAIIHRAYHALPPFTTKDGTMVNAVYGFITMLLKVREDLQPDYLAVSFDVSGPTFRDALYDKYKATRVKADQDLYDQIPLVYEVVKAFGIPIYTKEGFEADDVIGTIVEKIQDIRNTKQNQIESIIVTGDMDMLQLVDERVRVYELRKGLSDIVLFDAAKVKEKWSFPPERIVDYKALRGDASDNIPGVPGIGEKTAKELLAQIGGMDEIYKKIKSQNEKCKILLKPTVLKKLVDGENSARMSYELAKIRRDVPGIVVELKDCAVRPVDEAMVRSLLQKFEFFSLLKRLFGTRRAGQEIPVTGRAPAAPECFTVTAETVSEICRQASVDRLFVGKETDSGLVFLVAGRAYFVERTLIAAPAPRAALAALFANADITLAGHDLKRLMKAAHALGIVMANRLFDVMIASYVINSSTRAHDLASLVAREIGGEAAASDQASLFGVEPGALARDLTFILPLYEKFHAQLVAREDLGLFEEIEMRLIPVLAAMELQGVAVDVALLGKLSKQIAADIDRVTKKIWQEVGGEFNVASSVQLREVLFDKLKLPSAGVKKGKTGYSTAASELEKLRGMHPIIEWIEEHRELAKLQNTYVDVLPTIINKQTGRIHTTFNQAVAATGRLSSSDPNLQNIPIRTELGRAIRNAFIAGPGMTLVVADYSQIELRIVASLAEDERMIKIFLAGEDIHRATAAAMSGVSEDQVTREMRYAAKEVNFGVLYGMGAYGLSWRARIPQWQAEEFIQKYFTQFSGVKKYIDQTLIFAREAGYVETLFGRRRYIPELRADNYQLRSAGERMAVNMPIQGTAADLMKLAMIEVNKKLVSTAAKIILQVHDELVVETPEGTEEEIGVIVQTTMAGVAKLRVPIVVDVATGKRWGDLK